jgi:3-dehydroquinate synthase
MAADMVACERLRVSLGARSYDIVIGGGILACAGEQLAPLKLGKRGVILCDSNTEKRFAQPLKAALPGTEILSVPAGETSKSMQQTAALLEKLTGLGLDRKSFVIAVGGGVVGDLAGFVAAIYLRGIPFVQVPTTLLAQVDSSVGGKVGVNLPQGKNLVGAFYQPRLVLADLDTLKTLPERELKAGLAEVIKYGAIRDADFFKELEQGLPVGTRMVRRCCEIKAEVVGADETETTGVRAILNFGHTVGHALEAVSEYGRWLHGEAIAIGMCVAAELSVKRAGLSAADAARIRALVAKTGLPVTLDKTIKLADLLPAMRLDKKAEAGKLRFVLLKRLGEAFVSDAVTESDVEEALRVCR